MIVYNQKINTQVLGNSSSLMCCLPNRNSNNVMSFLKWPNIYIYLHIMSINVSEWKLVTKGFSPPHSTWHRDGPPKKLWNYESKWGKSMGISWGFTERVRYQHEISYM